jgi:molybdate transport system regulatory protein
VAKQGKLSGKAGRAKVELWVKLILPGVGQIGPGKIDLLRRIGDEQSIAAAARSMGMSYRRAWLLVDELNQMLTSPVVAKWQGGTSREGASLTALGVKLVGTYDAMVDVSSHASRSLLDEIGQSVGSGRGKARK